MITRRNDGDRGALAVGTQRARHSPDGLGDDRNGDELKAMQEPRPDRAFKALRAVSKEEEQDS